MGDYSPRLFRIGAGRNKPLCFRLLDFSPAVLLPTAKRGEININENRDFQLSISLPLRGDSLRGEIPPLGVLGGRDEYQNTPYFLRGCPQADAPGLCRGERAGMDHGRKEKGFGGLFPVKGTGKRFL